MRYHEFRAMNTDFLFAAEGSADEVEQGFHQVEAFIHASEQRFSRFLPDSELSALNQSSGVWFDASPEMFTLVTLAMKLHQQTKGLFDPAILQALEHAGYNRSMDDLQAFGPYPVGVATMLRPPVFLDVRLDAARRRIYMPVELRIDLGGIAKGWIAEQAAKRLTKWSKACTVDAGGDAFLIGRPAGEEFWRITLEDPCDADSGLAVLKLGPGAVATSSVTRRRWMQSGKEQHHVIDPRTQQPAATDWLSVTAIAPHAAEAEAAAKCLLIAGSMESRRVGQLIPGIEFIAVDRRKKLWGSKLSREYIDGEYEAFIR